MSDFLIGAGIMAVMLYLAYSILVRMGKKSNTPTNRTVRTPEEWKTMREDRETERQERHAHGDVRWYEDTHWE